MTIKYSPLKLKLCCKHLTNVNGWEAYRTNDEAVQPGLVSAGQWGDKIEFSMRVLCDDPSTTPCFTQVHYCMFCGTKLEVVE